LKFSKCEESFSSTTLGKSGLSTLLISKLEFDSDMKRSKTDLGS